jgi:hypothetical protein|tara:strand:+ start:300 stop:479 length:180 start_codon:yes stop_codon:yes gene_type:complete
MVPPERLENSQPTDYKSDLLTPNERKRGQYKAKLEAKGKDKVEDPTKGSGYIPWWKTNF